MTASCLTERLEATISAQSPFDALYMIATSLRDSGLSQLNIYRTFTHFLEQHQDDEPFGDAVADVLDCIWGGWSVSGFELFATALTNEELCVVSVGSQ